MYKCMLKIKSIPSSPAIRFSLFWTSFNSSTTSCIYCSTTSNIQRLAPQPTMQHRADVKHVSAGRKHFIIKPKIFVIDVFVTFTLNKSFNARNRDKAALFALVSCRNAIGLYQRRPRLVPLRTLIFIPLQSVPTSGESPNKQVFLVPAWCFLSLSAFRALNVHHSWLKPHFCQKTSETLRNSPPDGVKNSTHRCAISSTQHWVLEAGFSLGLRRIYWSRCFISTFRRTVFPNVHTGLRYVSPQQMRFQGPANLGRLCDERWFT